MFATNLVSGYESKSEYIINGKKVLLYRPREGQSVDVSKILADHSQRSKMYDFSFIDFDDFFTILNLSEVPENERINANTGKLRVLSFGSKKLQVNNYLNEITKIAQRKPEEVKKLKQDIVYRDALKNVCNLMQNDDVWREAEAVISPLRGGALIAQLLPISKDKIIPIDSKRLPLKKGQMGSGLALPVVGEARVFDVRRIVEKRFRELDNKAVQILEVAVASGITTVAYLLEMVDRGIHPRHIEIVAPVIAQQGVDIIFKVAEETGMNVSILAGKMYYRLGNFWKSTEDSILTDEGKFVIGRATDILSNFLNINEFTDSL